MVRSACVSVHDICIFRRATLANSLSPLDADGAAGVDGGFGKVGLGGIA
jgi:hypothetical protein